MTTLPPVPPEPTLPTQSAHPGRASWRTVVQNVIAAVITLGVVLPIAVEIVGDDLGAYLPPEVTGWLIAGAAFVAALAGALARVMAIPAVDQWLTHIGLSSRPKSDASATIRRG